MSIRERLRRKSQEEKDAARSGTMTLIDHLTELRRRMFICALAISIAAVVVFFPLYDPILDFLTEPYCDVLTKKADGAEVDCALTILDPTEGFTTRLRVAGYGGLFIALPVVLFQLWRFITPGLNPREKRYAVPFVSASVVLFICGAALSIYTFPKALDFLVSVGGEDIQTMFRPSSYIRLVLLLILAFGVAFEFPVVLVFLQLAGAISSRQLRDARRYAIVVIFVVAAVITPSQDPYTLLALAVPMCLFYEVAIIIGRVMKK